MTRRRPLSRSVRSLTSEMPWIFLPWTSVLIRSMTFSVPTPYGSSVTTMPLRRGVTASMRAVARLQKAPRPGQEARLPRLDPGPGPHPERAAPRQVGVPDALEPDDLAAGGQVGAGDEAHQ